MKINTSAKYILNTITIFHNILDDIQCTSLYEGYHGTG